MCVHSNHGVEPLKNREGNCHVYQNKLEIFTTVLCVTRENALCVINEQPINFGFSVTILKKNALIFQVCTFIVCISSDNGISVSRPRS